MDIAISDIPKNKDTITVSIAGIFHDLGIKEYIRHGEDAFHFIILRPAYERAVKKKIFGIISAWQVPYVETRVEISPVASIREVESDAKEGTDWFLTFNLENGRFLIVGVLHTYELELVADSKIEIHDLKESHEKGILCSGRTVKKFLEVVKKIEK